jgi:hypothetical protein
MRPANGLSSAGRIMRRSFEKSFYGTLAALAALAPACDAPKPGARPVLLTVADLQVAAATRPNEPLFPDSGVPGGLPLSDYVVAQGDTVSLTLRETWTHGYRSGYVTTELWSGFDEVWVQPMYVPVTGFTDAGPKVVKDGDKWHPIFSVGPDSAFYSPYWQIVYFQVPEGTAFDAYKSARDVLDAGLPLFPRRGKAIALVPKPVVLPATMVADTMVPGSDRKIGQPKQGFGYLDGEQVSTVEFDAETFTWNDARVVDEIPLFVLVWRRPDGALERLNVPTVAGTGPLYENRPVDISDETHPRYGAYWRIYTVELPSTARVFAPPQFTAFESKLPAAFPRATYGDDLAMEPDLLFLDDWLGRVALNATPVDGYPHGCFGKYDSLTGDAQDFPCNWLDSQPAIEKAVVPDAIKRTELVVTCPFVTYHDTAVAF